MALGRGLGAILEEVEEAYRLLRDENDKSLGVILDWEI